MVKTSIRVNKNPNTGEEPHHANGNRAKAKPQR
jgi:hypothetical protein